MPTWRKFIALICITSIWCDIRHVALYVSIHRPYIRFKGFCNDLTTLSADTLSFSNLYKDTATVHSNDQTESWLSEESYRSNLIVLHFIVLYNTLDRDFSEKINLDSSFSRRMWTTNSESSSGKEEVCRKVCRSKAKTSIAIDGDKLKLDHEWPQEAIFEVIHKWRSYISKTGLQHFKLLSDVT